MGGGGGGEPPAGGGGGPTRYWGGDSSPSGLYFFPNRYYTPGYGTWLGVPGGAGSPDAPTGDPGTVNDGQFSDDGEWQWNADDGEWQTVEEYNRRRSDPRDRFHKKRRTPFWREGDPR